jgi:predicted dehydrogenase
VHVQAVCDVEPRHALRAQGIAQKASGLRPDSPDRIENLLARDDVDAVLVALPCDLHAAANLAVLEAGKHLYAEKPLALTLSECDLIHAAALARPDQVVHIGHQRRANPRIQQAVSLLHAGEIGPLIAARASWTSASGPAMGHGGWLGSRARSGDFMLEQAVHLWDLLAWILQGPPAAAHGQGRSDLFAKSHPRRDVHDFYTATLTWPSGFHASFMHSWIEPASDASTGFSLRVLGAHGALDLPTGEIIARDRKQPRRLLNSSPTPDTTLALDAFVRAIRAPSSETAPSTIADARLATQIGLLVRQAVDTRRAVAWDELFPA